MSVFLNPQEVVFDGETLEHVSRVRLERKSGQVVSDTPAGLPYASFIDASGPQLEVIVERELVELIGFGPTLGAEGELSFEVAFGRSDGLRRTISLTAVLISSSVSFVRDRQAVQTLRFLGVSLTGETDPLQVGGI